MLSADVARSYLGRVLLYPRLKNPPDHFWSRGYVGLATSEGVNLIHHVLPQSQSQGFGVFLRRRHNILPF
jgi:hypothetical protein